MEKGREIWVLEEEHKENEELFNQIDSDKDGYATLADVENCHEVNSLLGKKELRKLFTACDLSGHNKLSSECFTLL